MSCFLPPAAHEGVHCYALWDFMSGCPGLSTSRMLCEIFLWDPPGGGGHYETLARRITELKPSSPAQDRSQLYTLL